MATFVSTQAQLILAARSHGYTTSNTKAERTLLCPQCGVKQRILFHKEGKLDILACPCGNRAVSALTGVEVVAEDDPRANPEPVEDDRCNATTRKGNRCRRKATSNGYCTIHSSYEGI